jgi:hypothetical protein
MSQIQNRHASYTIIFSLWTRHPTCSPRPNVLFLTLGSSPHFFLKPFTQSTAQCSLSTCLPISLSNWMQPDFKRLTLVLCPKYTLLNREEATCHHGNVACTYTIMCPLPRKLDAYGLSTLCLALSNQNMISITQFLLVLTARTYKALATFPYRCGAQMQKFTLTHLHLAEEEHVMLTLHLSKHNAPQESC